MWGNEWASPEGSIWRELESRVQCHSSISVFDPKRDGSQKCAMPFSWSECILLCKANCYSYAHSVKWSPLSPFSFIPIILPFSLCSSVIIVFESCVLCFQLNRIQKSGTFSAVCHSCEWMGFCFCLLWHIASTSSQYWSIYCWTSLLPVFCQCYCSCSCHMFSGI